MGAPTVVRCLPPVVQEKSEGWAAWTWFLCGSSSGPIRMTRNGALDPDDSPAREGQRQLCPNPQRHQHPVSPVIATITAATISLVQPTTLRHHQQGAQEHLLDGAAPSCGRPSSYPRSFDWVVTALVRDPRKVGKAHHHGSHHLREY